MSNCNNFICKYVENDICQYSGAPCTKEKCTGYYSRCDVCKSEGCLFKTSFLKAQENYISLLKYKDEKQKKRRKNTDRVYAVKVGRVPGIYHTWMECAAQIDGYPGAKYQAFAHEKDAHAYLSGTVAASKDSNVPRQNNNTAAYAYVDGSYNKFTKVYGYGVIFVDESGIIHKLSGNGSQPNMALMRNVAGEIEGAMAAMRFAVEHEIKNLVIYYDYTGIEAWPTGKWSANKEETQRYRDFCRLCPVKITYKKVKGHTGVEGNENADRLAKKAVGIG